MRIKKKETSVGILGKILNNKSNSKQDTYSADYIENNLEDINNKLNDTRGTILYDNTNGTTGDVTLSKSAADFEYIEVFFGRNGAYQSTRLFKPDGKNVSLNMSSVYLSDNHAYYEVLYGSLKISGNKLTKQDYGYFQTYDKSINNVNNTGNYIYVYRVIGYN